MLTRGLVVLRCSDIVRHHADSYAVAFPAGKVTQRGLLLCRLSPSPPLYPWVLLNVMSTGFNSQ